jgi:hypothetical protein
LVWSPDSVCASTTPEVASAGPNTRPASSTPSSVWKVTAVDAATAALSDAEDALKQPTSNERTEAIAAIERRRGARP